VVSAREPHLAPPATGSTRARRARPCGARRAGTSRPSRTGCASSRGPRAERWRARVPSVSPRGWTGRANLCSTR